MNVLNRLPQDTVLWGRSILRDAVSDFENYGIARPIVFTAPALQQFNRTYVRPHLKNAVGTFADLPPHVPDQHVNLALDACLANGAQSIVALGGGSVLDAAKAVSYLHHQRNGRHLPIAALATTLSGSEYSHYFGITETNTGHKFKRSYAVRETVPKLVVIDPVLVAATPRSLLLPSAIKALDHAIEGMRQVEKDHPHAIMAASGLTRIFRVLRAWPKHLETQEAIEHGQVTYDDLLQLQLGAWHCYFYPASVIYGLSHRVGHILGGTFGLPHSVTSCIALAPVIRACAGFYGDKLSIFAPDSPDDAAEKLAKTIATVVADLGLPDRIGSFDLAKDQLPEVARLLTANYPKEVADLGEGSQSKLVALLESMW
jgi:maleylacetate reductase